MCGDVISITLEWWTWQKNLPVSLALIEHLNLTEDTAAAVAWPFLDDLEQRVWFDYII